MSHRIATNKLLVEEIDSPTGVISALCGITTATGLTGTSILCDLLDSYSTSDLAIGSDSSFVATTPGTIDAWKLKSNNLYPHSGSTININGDISGTGDVSCVGVTASGDISGVDIVASGDLKGTDIYPATGTTINMHGDVSATGDISGVNLEASSQVTSPALSTDLIIPDQEAFIAMGSSSSHNVQFAGKIIAGNDVQANTIVAQSGTTVTIGDDIGDTLAVEGKITTTYDIECSGTVKTDTIWAKTGGSPIQLVDNVEVMNDLTLNSISSDTDTSKILSLDSSDQVKYVPAKLFRSPCVNQFFDDFCGYMPSTYENAGGVMLSFDTVWWYKGIKPYQVFVDRGGDLQTNFSQANGMALVTAVNMTNNGDGLYYGLNNFSSFSTINGDITYECSVSFAYPQRTYFTDLKLFFGLGRDEFNMYNDIDDMTIFAGFEYRFTLSASPNDYWSTCYDINGSGGTRHVSSVSFIDIASSLWKLKMIVSGSDIKYYINGNLIRTDSVSFGGSVKLQPRIGCYIIRSASNMANAYYGASLDYVFVSQDFNRSTI